MTVGYTTHWPKSMGPEYAGKPNHFVEKIWTGLIHEIKEINLSDYEDFSNQHDQQFGNEMVEYDQLMINPKLHTFRNDPHNRWKVGMKIHPVINNRTKNRFQFAPELEVKGIQKIEIKRIDEIRKYYSYGVSVNFKGETYRLNYEVNIDGVFQNKEEVKQLALNDGFDSPEQFFAWFNTDFSGKIIHWTDLKY